jgi:nitroimidazol reductase NimA-like FMN-containing flavoprotein (pyridoxamine 5'-phosphate oxidase superfamily)
MAEKDPVAELLPLSSSGSTPTDWPHAREHLTEAPTFWLATVRADGRPHVMPVLGAWLDGALYLCTPEVTRKARNLSANPRCVMAVNRGLLDLVVEGEATRVAGEDDLEAVGEAYATKYGWKVALRDGVFFADNGSGLGEMPFAVFRVNPTTAFGLDNEQGFSVTRWRF